MTARAIGTAVLAGMTFLGGCASTEQGRAPVHLWPLFDLETEPDSESLEVLWPLYFHEIKGDDHLTVRQVPLFTWKRRGQSRELDVLWPFFNVYWGGEKSGLRVAPIYFHGRSPTAAYDVVFPVFWWRREHHLHLWPLYYWDKKGGYGTLWPLIGFSKQQTRLLPFYYSSRTEEENTTFVFPYGSQTAGDRETRWVVPFYLDHHGPQYDLRLVLPFWFHSTDTARDKRSRVLFPFYWDFRDKEDVTTVFVPFYGRRHTTGGRDTYFIAPPLYIYDRDDSSERRTHHVFWPLFEHGSGPGYAKNRVFPIEYGWKEYALETSAGEEQLEYKSHFRVYPLYYANKRRTEGGETTHQHVLFPLWWYKDDETNHRSHNVVFPFLWHYRTETSATDVLFPLLWVNRDRTAEEKDYFAFLWPLTWYTSSPTSSDFRLLWKLVEVRSDDDSQRSLWAVNPLIRMESIGDDEKRFDVLGGLFGVHVRDGKTSVRLFYFLDL